MNKPEISRPEQLEEIKTKLSNPLNVEDFQDIVVTLCLDPELTDYAIQILEPEKQAFLAEFEEKQKRLLEHNCRFTTNNEAIKEHVRYIRDSFAEFLHLYKVCFVASLGNSNIEDVRNLQPQNSWLKILDRINSVSAKHLVGNGEYQESKFDVWDQLFETKQKVKKYIH